MKTNSRFSILYETFVSKGIISNNELIKIINTDPTTIIQEDGEYKVGKYSNWLLRTYIKAYELNSDFEVGTKEYEYQLNDFRHQFIDDVEINKYYLTKYEKFKSRIVDETKRDIMNIMGFSELKSLEIYITKDGQKASLSDYNGKIKFNSSVIENSNIPPSERFRYPGSEILAISENYTLVKISDKTELGRNAAVFFGGRQAGVTQPWDNKNTGDHSNESVWCTSVENSTHFQRYIDRGPLYIILSNKDNKVGSFTKLPKERYQFHFPNNEFKDRTNTSIDIEKELSSRKFKDFKEVLKPEFMKDITSG